MEALMPSLKSAACDKGKGAIPCIVQCHDWPALAMLGTDLDTVELSRKFSCATVNVAGRLAGSSKPGHIQSFSEPAIRPHLNLPVSDVPATGPTPCHYFSPVHS